MSARHRNGWSLFTTAGGFAPTLGILGTVLSLVHVLENLSTPGTLGHAIAGAFIATLYGVGSANLIFLPIAQQAQGAVGDRGPLPRDAARGDPLDPGRRQPAHAAREARDVRPAERPQRRQGAGARAPPRAAAPAAEPVVAQASELAEAA